MNNGKRIILIDDEEVIGFGFSKVLEEPGLKIDYIQSLEELRTCINTFTYDAAIVDLRLSNSTEMEGFECIRLLRSCQSKCRIIVLTAFCDNSFRVEAAMMGVTSFYEKPVEPAVIRGALKNIGIYDLNRTI